MYGMIQWGDLSDPANFFGPLISAKQRDRVLGYIEKGKAEGARLVLGGGAPRPTSRRASTWSPRSSPTSIPTRRSRKRRSSGRCCA
jgi:acyl-CoA reductase-like NAD-dependent aldehyde dehydrogenase